MMHVFTMHGYPNARTQRKGGESQEGVKNLVSSPSSFTYSSSPPALMEEGEGGKRKDKKGVLQMGKEGRGWQMETRSLAEEETN